MKKFCEFFVFLRDGVVLLFFALSLFCGFLSWYFTKKTLQDASIVLGIMISLIGIALDFFYASLKLRLDEYEERLNLHCERTDGDFRTIAMCIDFFIKEANANKSRLIGKRLNGVKEMLARKGLEEASIREEILKALEQSKTRFIATSLCNPAEWMDPNWFTYLGRQLAECTKKKMQNNKFTSKRYYINKQSEIMRYAEELLLLYKTHGININNTIAVEVFVVNKDILCENFQRFIEQPQNQFEHLKKVRNIDKDIPDFICIDNNFWFRDPKNLDKMTKVVSNNPCQTFSIEILEEWIRFLAMIEREEVSNLLYSEKGLSGFLTMKGA